MKHPVFGTVKTEAGCWSGRVALPAFAALGATDEHRAERLNARERKALDQLGLGLFAFKVNRPDQDDVLDAETLGPSPEQEAAFRYLCDQADVILASLKEAILDWHNTCCEDEYVRSPRRLSPLSRSTR